MNYNQENDRDIKCNKRELVRINMIKSFYISAFFLTFPLLVSAEATPDLQTKSKNARLFSIAITVPMTRDVNDFWKVYEDALDLAIDTGIDLPGELSFIWSKTEKRSIFGKTSFEDEMSKRVVEFLKRKNLPAVITISPFETMNSRIPEDLIELPYNHPKVMARFKEFIDWIYEVTTGLEAVSIVLGNEFDVHLASEAAKGNNYWQEFEDMVAQTKDYVKSLDRWRSIPFAIEPTYGGLTGFAWRELKQINLHTDIIGVSYYPLSENTVHEPTILRKHFIDLFSVYPDKKIDFYQYGYPSSTKINGSLDKQRRFVEETFKYWDKYLNKIRLITFTWLYDVQQVHIDQMSDDTLEAITPTEAFLEFLGSLGLHGKEIGEEKPAFRELKKQLGLRKWSQQSQH